MATPAERLQVGVRGGALGEAGSDVVELGPKTIAAVDTAHPVERGWLSQLEGDQDLDRDVSRPSSEVAQILAVEEDSGKKGILGDLPGDLRRDRDNPGNLAYLSLPHVHPTSLRHVVADQYDELGTTSPSLARTRQKRGVGIGEIPFEGLL